MPRHLPVLYSCNHNYSSPGLGQGLSWAGASRPRWPIVAPGGAVAEYRLPAGSGGTGRWEVPWGQARWSDLHSESLQTSTKWRSFLVEFDFATVSGGATVGHPGHWGRGFGGPPSVLVDL